MGGIFLSLSNYKYPLRCALLLFSKLLVFPVLPMVSRVFVGSSLLTCTGIVCWAGVNLMHFSSIARDGGTDAFLDFLLESD